MHYFTERSFFFYLMLLPLLTQLCMNSVAKNDDDDCYKCYFDSPSTLVLTIVKELR